MHVPPPGCSHGECALPAVPDGDCALDFGDRVDKAHLWLFDVVNDPLELCNLAESRPTDAQALLQRLRHYNETLTPDDVTNKVADTSWCTAGVMSPWVGEDEDYESDGAS